MHAQRAATIGDVRDLIAAWDWSASPLGDMRAWAPHLRSIVALAVEAPLPVVTFWGPEGIQIYNEAYARLAGDHHPAALGAAASDGWPETAELNRRLLRAGLAGESLILRDQLVALHRRGSLESAWFDFDSSPVRNEAGDPVGVFVIVRETTGQVKAEQRRVADLETLRAARLRQRCLAELGDTLRNCETPSQISGAVSKLLGRTLGCARTGYAVVTGAHAVVQNDWTDGRVASLSGQHKFADLGARYVAEIRSGNILAAADVRRHPVVAESAASWLGIGVRALLNVPLLQDGAPVALLYAHETAPRDWTQDEVALVKEVADRTWEAMGRARAVEALRRLNETLEAQVRERTLQRDRIWTLSTDIMMVTGRSGAILSVNPAATRLLGWREDELLGASLYDFVHPDDLATTREKRRELEQGRAVDKFENRYRARDGSFRWLSWKSAPDGEFMHSVARDVTAEREQAEALRAAEDALRQSQKMEAVGQLTGGIAHDFNNLLQGILGSLALSQKRIEQGRIEELARYNAQARSAAERASALTHRLLAFSRRQPLDPKPVEINALALALEPLLRRTLGESVRLRFDLAPDLWPTLCDANQLDSAILNLAINARDAMPGGGALTIRTHNVFPTFGPQAPAAQKVCLAVVDTGAGMPRDVAERAFDPFFTTKPIGQGTGLGLSMVYGFMRQSGGEAGIESAPNAGTTVRLWFPRYAGPMIAEALDDRPAAAPTAAGRGGAALVVEDEDAVRRLVCEVLQDLGFAVVEAVDGPSGLEILQSARRIDLLVTDIGLPGLNGRQVAEAARLARPELKILFMTGYADVAVMSEGFLTEGMDLIPKPFAIEALTARIQRLAGGCAGEPA